VAFLVPVLVFDQQQKSRPLVVVQVFSLFSFECLIMIGQEFWCRIREYKEQMLANYWNI
jgi:hypothetical protein